MALALFRYLVYLLVGRTVPRRGRPGFQNSPLLEQAEQGLRRRVGERECLSAQLLADLQRCQLCQFLRKVRITSYPRPLLRESILSLL